MGREDLAAAFVGPSVPTRGHVDDLMGLPFEGDVDCGGDDCRDGFVARDGNGRRQGGGGRRGHRRFGLGRTTEGESVERDEKHQHAEDEEDEHLSDEEELEGLIDRGVGRKIREDRDHGILEWDVSVFFGWAGIALGQGGSQGEGDAGARTGRGDHIGDHGACGGLIRGCKLVAVLFDELGSKCGGVLGGFDFFAEEDPSCAFRAHDGDLRSGPGEDEVRPEVRGTHGEVGPPIGFAHDQGDLGDGGRRVGEEHLGSVADDSAAFLGKTRHEARGIDEVDDGNVEDVAGADEARAFVGGVDVEGSGADGGLVRDDADHDATDSGKADDEVLRKVGHDFHEAVGVDQSIDDQLHVERGFRVVRHQLVHAEVRRGVDGLVEVVGGIGHVVRGQVGKKPRCEGHGVSVVTGHEVDVAADRGMGCGGGELGEFGVFPGGGFDDARTADEHVGVLLGHDEEVHQGWGIRGTPGAGSGDDGDLGNDAGKEHVFEEDLAVARKGVDALLNARSAGVIDCHHGDADVVRVVHELADFARMDAPEGAAADGEVLAVGGDGASFDKAGPTDHAIIGQLFGFHAERGAAVLGVHAEFLEGARVEKGFEALAGCEHALLFALGEFVQASGFACLLAAIFEVFQ